MIKSWSSLWEKKMQSYQVSERTAEHYILKNDVFDLNHALPKMLSKIRLKNMISGKRKQITSATQGGWPQAWNLMSTWRRHLDLHQLIIVVENLQSLNLSMFWKNEKTEQHHSDNNHLDLCGLFFFLLSLWKIIKDH